MHTDTHKYDNAEHHFIKCSIIDSSTSETEWIEITLTSLKLFSAFIPYRIFDRCPITLKTFLFDKLNK